MTDEEAIEACWDPWVTKIYSELSVTDSCGATEAAPFAAYAGSFGEAKLSMKLHLGIVLREHGFRPAWLKER